MSKINNTTLKKAKSIQSKIEEISKKFDIAETMISEDATELAEPILKHKEIYHPIDVMSLENMVEDFKFSRKVLKETISYGRKVLQKIALDSLTEEKKVNTMGFAELSSSILNGIRIHSQIYKDFSAVLLNIKNLKEEPDKDSDKTNKKPINTIDLIQQLKDERE